MIQGETVLPTCIISNNFLYVGSLVSRAVEKNCRAFQPQLSTRAVCFDFCRFPLHSLFILECCRMLFEVQNLTAQWCTVINEPQKPYWKDTAHGWISKFPTRPWIIFQSLITSLSITPSPSPSLLVIFFQSGDVAERLEYFTHRDALTCQESTQPSVLDLFNFLAGNQIIFCSRTEIVGVVFRLKFEVKWVQSGGKWPNPTWARAF